MLYITVLGWFFTGLNNFFPIWSWEIIFGVDKHLPKGLPKMCQKFLSDPQKPPNRQQFLTRKAFLDSKFWTKFYSQNRQEVKMGQKTRPDVLKSFLMFIFTVPIILSDAEISTALGDFLKILTCGSKIFKNDPTFKMVKIIILQHLIIFSFILGKLGQLVHICLILPPRNFYRPREPPENWYFDWKMH